MYITCVPRINVVLHCVGQAAKLPGIWASVTSVRQARGLKSGGEDPALYLAAASFLYVSLSVPACLCCSLHSHPLPLRKNAFHFTARLLRVAMRRGAVEVKRIENSTSRQVTFSKRRGGLLKKAHELAVLCDAQVGVVVFSSRGKLFEYCSPNCSWRELIHRYETTGNTQGTNQADQKMFAEITMLRHERDHLEANLRRQTGEELSPVATAEQFDNLQQQLESALAKVHERKYELLNQQLDDAHHKVLVLEDQNRFLRHMISEDWQHRAAAAEAPAVATEAMVPMLPATASFTDFFPREEAAEASTSLQMWPQVQDVQLAQPNTQQQQDLSLTGDGLRLW